MHALQPPAFEEYRGWFSDTVIRSPHLCTAMNHSPCHIIAQIPVCNELLYSVQLELQEHSPGQLGIGALDYVHPKPVREYEIDLSFHLLSCLLSNHRCIASLHIKYWNYLPKYKEMIISSYRANVALKSLKLGREEWLIRAVAPTMEVLTGLEELECGQFTDRSNFIEPLCCLLTKSSVLKKLTLSSWIMTTDEASLVHSALSKNSTLTDLSIHWSCVMPEDANLSVEFAESLEKSTMLQTLVFSGFVEDREVEVKYLIDAVGRSKSLINLTLHCFVINDEASAAIEHFLSGNCILRRLSIEYCRWYPGEPYSYYDNTEEIGVLSARIRPWISILEKNRSLEELRLNLMAFSPADGRAFFAELRKNTILKRVVIDDIYLYFHMLAILASSDSSQKKADVSPPDRPDVLITQCRQLSNLSLFLFEQQDVAWMKMAVRALNSCSHVTKLTIIIPDARIDDTMEALITDYIKNTNTLIELTLGFFPITHDANEPTCKMNIIEALKQNSSLRKLLLETERLTMEEAAVFAAMVRSSKRICRLRIRTSTETTELLVESLFPGFSKNYTLLSLVFYRTRPPLTRECYFIKTVVRRNHDLVTLAAHCATGNNSRRCVEAMELVAENPALVEKICELQSVREQDAAQIVRNARGAVLGLDDYMRVTGVVKSRVSCRSGDDHRLKLDDLDEYSWRHIRRLLRLSDILPSSSSSDE